MELWWLKLLYGKYSLNTFNFISKVVKADQLFDYTDIFDENMAISADFPPKMLLTRNAAIFNILSTSPENGCATFARKLWDTDIM